MIYGYCRCSTDETRQDVKRQERELRAAGAECVVCEYEHGTTEHKAEQERLFATVSEGDTIIVTEISRLTRSTKQLCFLLDLMKEKRLRLQVLNSVTIDCRSGEPDPMTQAFLQMAGVFAELERAMIVARVRSGMANARAKGKQIGRPTMTAEDLPAAFWRLRQTLTHGGMSKAEMARALSISRPTLDRWLKIADNA